MDKEREGSGNQLDDPDIRIKLLSDHGTSVVINPNVPIRRYYRSGVEMINMANVYVNEGTLEKAYILYHKFMTIFLEKIQRHPQYSSVSAKDRADNVETLKQVLSRAEALKVKLLDRYRAEQARYRAEAERQRLEREAKARLRRADDEDERNKFAASRTPGEAARVLPGVSVDTTEFALPAISPLYPDIDADESDPSANWVPSADEATTPSIDRSTKPSATTTRDKHALRRVILSSRTMRDFLLVAHENTADNKETCGVLAGKLEHDNLLVTHLLIPRQTGTADSCATRNEEEIFDYQDQHNLITLGWIHTHPTQTAFLSSVDLHTHCAYQLMMSEAIAIVCAPKYDETGFFMLTPEYGLNFIASCRQTGFHPHPTEPPLYTEAMHCILSPKAEIELVDLRKK